MIQSFEKKDKSKKNKDPAGRYAPQTMAAHAKEILPIRNSIMHTNEITEDVMNWDKIKNIIDYVEKLETKNNE